MAKTITKLPALKIAPPDNIWKDYDAKRASASLERIAGSWSDIDTDKWIADIRRWRKEGSRP